MFPFIVIVALVGGIAYAAKAKADRDPTSLPDVHWDPPVVDDVDDHDDDDHGLGDLPVIEPAGIPYGPRLLFELWLGEDGELRDGDGDAYDAAVDIDVCVGDTVVMHVPPQAADDDAVGWSAADVPWLIAVVEDWDSGLFVWHVVEGPEGDRTASFGVEVFDYEAQEPLLYRFDAVLLHPWECEEVA